VALAVNWGLLCFVSLQAGGQGFESPHVHQIPLQKAGLTSAYRPVLISFYRDFTNDTSRTRSTKSKARANNGLLIASRGGRNYREWRHLDLVADLGANQINIVRKKF
jgi:hypothetical protein